MSDDTKNITLKFQRELDKARTELSNAQASHKKELEELTEKYRLETNQLKTRIRNLEEQAVRDEPKVKAKLREEIEGERQMRLKLLDDLEEVVAENTALEKALKETKVLLQNAETQSRDLRERLTEAQAKIPHPPPPHVRIRRSRRRK
jgi:predicted  nucleic acid-binding Zn-ribbon protein